MDDQLTFSEANNPFEINLQNVMFSLGLPESNEEQDVFLDSIENFLGGSSQNPNPPSLVQELSAGIDRRKFRIPITMEERYARNQEKNRRAQKRFREKQKVKYSAMEAQVEELNQKIQTLEIEKKELKDRTELLERILCDKEKSANTQTNSATTQNSFEPIDQAADSEKIKQAEGTFYFSTVNKIVTSDMIRNMRVPEVSKYLFDLWEDVVIKTTQILKEADVEKPPPEKIQELQKIVNECNTLVLRLFTINPVGVKYWSYNSKYNPYNYVKSEAELENFMGQIVDKLDLNESQKGVITFLWNRFQDVQEECMKQRKDLSVQLQTLARRQTTQWKFFEDFMRTHELLFEIRENWRQEYRNHWDFMMLLSNQVFTPIQYARIIVYMYPIVGDDFIFSRVVAKQVQQQRQQPTPQKSNVNIPHKKNSATDQQKFCTTEKKTNNIFNKENLDNVKNAQNGNNQCSDTRGNVQQSIAQDDNNYSNICLQSSQIYQLSIGDSDVVENNNSSINNGNRSNTVNSINNTTQNINDINTNQNSNFTEAFLYQQTNVTQINNTNQSSNDQQNIKNIGNVQEEYLPQYLNMFDCNASNNNNIPIDCNNSNNDNRNNNNNNIPIDGLQETQKKDFQRDLQADSESIDFGRGDSFDLDELLNDQQRGSFDFEGIIQS